MEVLNLPSPGADCLVPPEYLLPLSPLQLGDLVCRENLLFDENLLEKPQEMNAVAKVDIAPVVSEEKRPVNDGKRKQSERKRPQNEVNRSKNEMKRSKNEANRFGENRWNNVGIRLEHDFARVENEARQMEKIGRQMEMEARKMEELGRQMEIKGRKMEKAGRKTENEANRWVPKMARNDKRWETDHRRQMAEKEAFANLCEIVPDLLVQKRPSKMEILKKTISYINGLQKDIEKLEKVARAEKGITLPK